jgi:hypothetical protein
LGGCGGEDAKTASQVGTGGSHGVPGTGGASNPDDVRDDTGVSILDPAHPWHDRLGTIDVRDPNTDTGGPNEAGTFRLKCDFSHGLYDDPIVYPGQAGRAHLHMFFGNHTADAHSTERSLFENGETTCQGSELNRSSYWIPMLLAPRWQDGQVVRDDAGNRLYDPVLTIDSAAGENAGPDFYYKRATAGTITPMPLGLRMIVGSASASEPQEYLPLRYACESSVHSDSPEFTKHIPICEVGDVLNADVWFPPCWDGENLDVPDHKSHMAFPRPADDGSGDYVCPPTHPVSLPQVSYHFKFPVTAENGGPTGSTRGWKLASDKYQVPEDGAVGGYSLHADWFMAWHPEASALFTEYCINQRRHCSNGDLGNGFRMVKMVQGPRTIPPIINEGHGEHAGH